jgi:predicted amidohydrolase
MKDKVTVALVQMDVALMDVEKNLSYIKGAVEKAKKERNPDLIVFPELSSIGYIKPRDKEFGLKYIKASERIPGMFTDTLSELARKFGVCIISGMTQQDDVIPGSIYNAAVLIDTNGNIVGKVKKVHIPGFEKHYFVPGGSIDVFDTHLGRLGIAICYDGQYPEATRVLAVKGAEILIMLYNVPSFSNDPKILHYLTATRAFENRFYALSCNRIGEHLGMQFVGHSAVADPLGALIATAGAEETIIYADLEYDNIIRERAQQPIFRDRRPELYGELIKPL